MADVLFEKYQLNPISQITKLTLHKGVACGSARTTGTFDTHQAVVPNLFILSLELQFLV